MIVSKIATLDASVWDPGATGKSKTSLRGKPPAHAAPIVHISSVAFYTRHRQPGAPQSNIASTSRKCHRSVERRILQLLHDRHNRTQLTQIHFLRHHLHQSKILLAHFISVCASLGKLSYALLVFSLRGQNLNLLLFNSMIKGCSRFTAASQESLHLFSLMRSRGICPNQFTFAPLLKSCTNLSGIVVGRGVHAESISAGLERHPSVQIVLVELYAGCDRMVDARMMFDVMPHRDVVVWNMMIRGYCQGGDLESGYRLFRHMGERSLVTWNAMIAGFAHARQGGNVLELFREMRDEGFEPDDATIVTVLPVCARLGALDVERWIHSLVDGRGFFKDSVNVGNSLVDMYCKCGDLKAARVVFVEMPRKSVVSRNTMISGLAFNGQGETGVDVFEEMKRQGVLPNDVTYIGILGCCTHAGLVQRGREFFDSMVREHGIEPRLEHYGCMVDLLGRSGYVKEAYELIRSMPMRPSSSIWGALLSACRIHSNIDVAQHAAKKLIDLEPLNSGNYVLLYNIYADAADGMMWRKLGC